MVDDAFGIMHVPVLAGAARRVWVLNVADVDVDQPGPAGAVSGLCAHHGEPVGSFRALHDVVGSPDGEIVEPAGQVVGDAEVDG